MPLMSDMLILRGRELVSDWPKDLLVFPLEELSAVTMLKSMLKSSSRSKSPTGKNGDIDNLAGKAENSGGENKKKKKKGIDLTAAVKKNEARLKYTLSLARLRFMQRGYTGEIEIKTSFGFVGSSMNSGAVCEVNEIDASVMGLTPLEPEVEFGQLTEGAVKDTAGGEDEGGRGTDTATVSIHTENTVDFPLSPASTPKEEQALGAGDKVFSAKAHKVLEHSIQKALASIAVRASMWEGISCKDDIRITSGVTVSDPTGLGFFEMEISFEAALSSILTSNPVVRSAELLVSGSS